MPKKKIRKIIRRRTTPITTNFSYRQPEVLYQFLTDEGAILTRPETGLNQKDQRRLAVEIKRARHLALVPFTQTL